jgi:3-oxoadipate enol-lactonase
MHIQLKDFSMAYTDAGQGLPLLFIHGYPLSRSLWQLQIEALSDVARVLAPDLRGFGDSQSVPGPYSMDLFADDLNAFLDALGIAEPAVICGLSMGGYVAFAFYRKYAHRVRGLVLTSTRAAPDTAEGKARRDQAAAEAMQAGVASVVDGMLPKLLAPQNLKKRPELVERASSIMASASLQGVVGALNAMKERPDSTPTLGRIAVPTLVVHGAEDSIVPLEEARQMAAAIPGARLEVIPDAGHLLNIENPQVYNQALRQFLDSLEVRRL